MPLITLDEACTHDGPSSAACAARDGAELARNELLAKTCAQLFPNQDVMQTACILSCRSYKSGDGQDCAFNYSRSLHEVALENQARVRSSGRSFSSAHSCVLRAGHCFAPAVRRGPRPGIRIGLIRAACRFGRGGRCWRHRLHRHHDAQWYR